jgi:hypothetical protein
MVKKSILLVSSSFYPEISPRSFRATELAKEFCRQGHDVVVISKFRDHDYSGFLKEYSLTLRMWSKPSFPEIPEFKTRILSTFSRGLSRILALLIEYPRIEQMFQVNKILRSEEGYDLMISFAVPFPVHWGVANARSGMHRIARKWVADCGDPYMFSRLDTFRKPFYFRYLEEKFCNRCDYITIPFEQMKYQFYSKFVPKIMVVPQGFNFLEIKLFEGKINRDKPVFMFAGSVIPGKRDLKLFLEFLSTLKTDFQFIVYTNHMDWFRQFQSALGEKLQINGFIDRLALIYELSKADFVVNVDTILDNGSNTEAIPSKLIDYALSSRPILNINSATLDEQKVLDFMNQDYSRQRIIEKSSFNIKLVTSQFLDLLN